MASGARAFGGAWPVVVVAAVLLIGWELLASWYFSTSVRPEFRVGAITGADPTVPAEMRVVQTRLPFPSLVLLTLFDPANADQLWLAGLITLRAAAVGFAIGGVVGFALGLAMDLARGVERGLLPYVIASQMIPAIALGPIFYSVFRDENLARALIAAYVTFFPVTVNTLRGLRSVDSAALDLMASYAASRRQVYTMLRIPSALPYLFQALKVAATASVVGAVVVELMGAQQGIGVTILRTQYYGPANAYKLWGAIVVASVIGLALFQAVSVAERLLVHWQPELREGGR